MGCADPVAGGEGVQYSGGLSDSGGTMGAQMITQPFSTQGIFGRA